MCITVHVHIYLRIAVFDVGLPANLADVNNPDWIPSLDVEARTDTNIIVGREHNYNLQFVSKGDSVESETDSNYFEEDEINDQVDRISDDYEIVGCSGATGDSATWSDIVADTQEIDGCLDNISDYARFGSETDSCAEIQSNNTVQV